MKKILISLVTIGHILSFSTSAWACDNVGPFDFFVTEIIATRGSVTEDSKPATLKFATMADKDSVRVQSDSPFIIFPTGDGEISTWGIDLDADTRLSAEYSMLEVKDYIKKNAGLDIPLTDDNLRALQGVTLHGIATKPNENLLEPLSKIVGAEKAKAAVRSILKKSAEAMAQGVPNFERASFLSSKGVTDTFGYNTTALCMSMAFGRDKFSNPDEGIRQYLDALPAYTLRASLVDNAAAIATKDPTKTSFKLMNGKLNCQLKPSTHFELQMPQMRCAATILQSGPVVRGVQNGDETQKTASHRYIQIGESLNEVICSDGKNSVNLSRMPEDDDAAATSQLRDMNQLLAEAGQGIEETKGSALGKKLKALDPSAKDYILTAAALCDEHMTGKVTGSKAQAGSGGTNADEDKKSSLDSAD